MLISAAEGMWHTYDSQVLGFQVTVLENLLKLFGPARKRYAEVLLTTAAAGTLPYIAPEVSDAAMRCRGNVAQMIAKST